MIRLSGSVKLLCSLGFGASLSAAAATSSGAAPLASARSFPRFLARSSNRPFASRIFSSRPSRLRNSAGNSSPLCSGPYSASSASSTSAARRSNSFTSPSLQLGFHLLYAPVAHGFVLGGVGLVFAPI